jgi:hypothetical protein
MPSVPCRKFGTVVNIKTNLKSCAGIGYIEIDFNSLVVKINSIIAFVFTQMIYGNHIFRQEVFPSNRKRFNIIINTLEALLILLIILLDSRKNDKKTGNDPKFINNGSKETIRKFR